MMQNTLPEWLQDDDSLKIVHGLCLDIARQVDRSYVAAAGRKNEVPVRLWELWASSGLLGVGLPEKYGGVGGGLTELVYALDLLSQEGLILPLIIPNIMSRVPLIKHGTQAQKDELLPKTATGEAYFSFAITEPDAGTNAFKTSTTATRQYDGSYLLNGTKHYITGFAESQYCLLVARTQSFDADARSSGLTLFIVDPRSAGISATPMDIGLHLPERQYVVSLNDVPVSAEAILGTEGNGIEVLFDCLNPERLLGGAGMCGRGDYVLRKASEYASQRAPFDKPIGAYQAVQHPLAVAKVYIEGARAMLYNAVRLYDTGHSDGLKANMVKYLASRGLNHAVDAAVGAYGGAFADMQTDLISFMMHAKLSEVAPVNNNSALSYIATKGLGLPKSY